MHSNVYTYCSEVNKTFLNSDYKTCDKLIVKLSLVHKQIHKYHANINIIL